MKGNRKSTRANKTGTAASDVSHPDGSLQHSSALPQNKKLHLYNVTAVLQQQKSEETRKSCLANGSTVVLTDPILKDKSRKDFPKDFTDFGFPKKQNSLSSNKIYSLAEEPEESDSDILDWVREETVEKPLAEEAEQEENESKCLMEEEESVLEDQEEEHIASPHEH